MDTKFLSEDKFVKCAGRADTVKKWFGIEGGPEPPVGAVPLTELPIGYNLRGKRIVFTEIDRPMGVPWSQDGFDVAMYGGDMETMTAVGVQAHISDNRIEAILIQHTNGTIDIVLYDYIHGGWNQDALEFQVPDDMDYPVLNFDDVGTAPVFAHTGDNWGFDFAFVMD